MVDRHKNKVLRKGFYEYDSDEIFDQVLGPISDEYPEMSLLELLFLSCPKVCPKSLLTEEVNEIITMESFCREYNVSPDQYLDYPRSLITAFGTVSGARERVRAKEMKISEDNNGISSKT